MFSHFQTLVIAAASVDDVLAISGFSVLLGIAFKTGGSCSPEVTEPLTSSETGVPLLVGSYVSQDGSFNNTKECEEADPIALAFQVRPVYFHSETLLESLSSRHYTLFLFSPGPY